MIVLSSAFSRRPHFFHSFSSENNILDLSLLFPYYLINYYWNKNWKNVLRTFTTSQNTRRNRKNWKEEDCSEYNLLNFPINIIDHSFTLIFTRKRYSTFPTSFFFLICRFLFMRGMGLYYFSLGYRNTSTKSINRYRNPFFRRFSFSNKNFRKTSRPATYSLDKAAPKTHDRFTRSGDIKRTEIIRSILPTYKREIKREEFRKRNEKNFQRNDWRRRCEISQQTHQPSTKRQITLIHKK